MRIVHIDTGKEMRGGQWQALLLMQGLAKLGHQQILLTPDQSPLSGAVQRAEIGSLVAGDWSPPLGALPPADIIHAHDAGAHTAAVLRRRSSPLVVSRRVAFPVRRSWMSRWKYAQAAHYVAISQFVARELEFARVPESKITVVFDGVPFPDLTRRSPLRAAFRKQHKIPADAFVAGTLTSLREKPLSPLLEAAQTRPRLHVLVASADSPQHSASERVQFLPRHADISPFLFALDAFVYLSEAEGLGSAALLAMAHGLPVVASDVGGLPEIVRPGETGFLVNNIAEEVGAALEKLFADRAEAAALGQRGRRFVEANATDDIMTRRTEQVYLQTAALMHRGAARS